MAVEIIIPDPASKQERLEELGRKWNVSPVSKASPLLPPAIPPRYAKESDRLKARNLVLQIRRHDPKHKESSSGLKGVFKSRKAKELANDPNQFDCTWKEACTAIASLIESHGSPGVAETLIELGTQSQARLQRKSSINVLKKMRRSDEPDPLRGQNLERAVKSEQVDMVKVLVRGAIQSELNTALYAALTNGNREIIEVLLANGADANRYPDVFQQVVENNSVEIVRLMLRSPKPINEECIAPALSLAVRSKSKKMSSLLSAYGSNFNQDSAQALNMAIHSKDVGLAVSILMNRPSHWDPLMGASLDSLVGVAWDKQFEEKEAMIEALLCAGAAGETVAATLAKTVRERKTSIARLLITYGASVNYHHAECLRLCIASHDSNMLRTIMQGKPSAKYLAESLIHSTKERQIPLMRILLEHGAPVDHKDGAALQLAVKSDDIDMIDLILSHKPSLTSMEKAFPMISNGSSEIVVTSKFLNAGLRGAAVDASLAAALTDATNFRKNDLILILASAANADYNGGELLQIAAGKGDLDLLTNLLQGNPTPDSVSSAIPTAMRFNDFMCQYKMIQLLLSKGATGEPLSQALLEAIEIEAKANTKNLDLIRLLLKSSADVNYKQGEAVENAVKASSGILQLVVIFGEPNSVSVDRGLQVAVAMKERRDRVQMVELLLQRNISQPVLDSSLIQEMEVRKPGYVDVVQMLLDKSADVNSSNGKAIQLAVQSGNLGVLDLMILKEPSMHSLEMGFPLAVRMAMKDDKFEAVQRFLNAGVKGLAVDKALADAVKQRPVPKTLCKLLLDANVSVDYNGGEAIRTASDSGEMDLLKQLLTKSPSQSSLSSTFKSALWLKKREHRQQVMELLLHASMNDEDVAVGLIYLVKEEPYDVSLVKLFLDYNASVDWNNGESVRFAAQSGRVEVLELLVLRKPTAATLAAAFSPALDLRVPELRLRVVRMLLQAGLTGDGLGAALVRCLRETTRDPRLIKLLLDHNADVNYNDGEALQVAAENGESDMMELLLTKKPNAHSLGLAVPYLFLSKASEEETSTTLEMFLALKPDVNLKHPDCLPLIFMSMKHYPRSVLLIQMLLDAGCRADQGIPYVVNEANGVEYVTPLLWALYQRNDQISANVICALIQGGANPSFRAASGKTPVLLAAEHSRTQVLDELIKRSAHLGIEDRQGATALMCASRGGDTSCMQLLLDAGAPRDDGSIHEAARELHADAVKLLLSAGHHSDYPSPVHLGHTALQEICLRASCKDPIKLKDTIRVIFEAEIDLSVKMGGKSTLLLAIDNSENPYALLKSILECGGWKRLNDEHNHYADPNSNIIYGPTTYVSAFCGHQSQQADLISLLKHHRCKDVLYATEGPQPANYAGAPKHIIEAERHRLAELERIAHLEHRHGLALRHERETAEQKAALDLAKHNQELKMREDAERRLLAIQTADHRARVQRSEEIARREKEVSERESEREIRRLSAAEKHAAIEANLERERRETLETKARIEKRDREEAEALAKREHERQISLLKQQKVTYEAQAAAKRAAGVS